MDAYEATKTVFQRIQTLDPQNAAKIMGLLLIQDHGEKEMIRLAFGPESLLHSVILKAKKELSLAQPNTPSPPTPPFPNPSLSRQNSCPSSAPQRLNLNLSLNLPSPLGINAPPSWTNSGGSFSDDLMMGLGGYSSCSTSSNSTMNSAAAPFYGTSEIDLIDELNLQDQLSFLNDGSPGQIGGKSCDFYYQDLALSPNGNAPCYPPWGGLAGGHRRSHSVSDMYVRGSDDVAGGGLGWKPCLFYARGYCKNGSSCRFLHGGADDAMMEPPPELLLRSKPQQLLSSSPSFSYSPKCISLLDTSRALMMGDGMHKFGRFGLNPGSRQIYLTFPADSTFKEEDVSNYFSNFGPVQDVRIPYQQKRMFGFVTFEFPETVKLILAKGNPHFVCDARVLVKPYKEKGKIPDKHRKQQQQIERGEFAGLSSSPNHSELESKDLQDFQLGARMFYGAHDDLWRRKLEEAADLHQTIELQNRRFMGLQLLDVKRKTHQCPLSGSPVAASPSPVYSPTSFFNFNVMSSNQSSPEARQADGDEAPHNAVEKEKEEIKFAKDDGCPNESGSFDHNLPDSPFASRDSAGGFSATETEKCGAISDPLSRNGLITGTAFPTTSVVDVSPPFKTCYFHVPRFASGRETVGM
ncbi:zinc finger CCCH domain-containing protein 53 isoform X2 [Andrographis paniculata]|uniref:zinc finger CCCH domain-containing protein 53 isoform X2 n=1 Tax=Andrographis paniculata TaxID=175694 RepID=UPI0021E7A94C|nr:zinc finger CCCH domain-containing protein 53 isoform X2 [Andrographis paniculata]